MSDVQAPPATQAQKEQIHRIFFKALKQVVPGLQPSNIQVEEHRFEPRLGGYSPTEVKALTGCSSEPGVNTNITFSGIDIGFGKVQALKDIVDRATGVWSSFNEQGIHFKGSATTLLDRLNVPDFEHAVRSGIPSEGKAR